MGFKPKSKLKIHHYVKPSNFIYPDETVSGGSGKGSNGLFLLLLFYRQLLGVPSYSLHFFKDASQEKWLPSASIFLVTTLCRFL